LIVLHDNSTEIYNKYWIWNPLSNNWVANAWPYSGSEKYIQVGQGFFVETKQHDVSVQFNNNHRVNKAVVFRDNVPNKLIIKALGGLDGYEDKLSIRFDNNATDGYDIDIEAVKRNSHNGDATMIRSKAEDNTDLSINVLPLEMLEDNTTSIPILFNCGYNTDYNLFFSGVESFETGVEVWLEDIVSGGDWIKISSSTSYTFYATSQDDEERVFIHFLRPTLVNEKISKGNIKIFAHEQFAHVQNISAEIIDKIMIFNMSGELIHSCNTVNENNSRHKITQSCGCYIVKVITNRSVYSDLIFVSN
jgi:hypothetical protein